MRGRADGAAQAPRMPLSVRRLSAADAIAYRALRLESLRLHPEAFGSTLADWEAAPQARFVERIEQGCVFGLFLPSGLVGLLAYDREKGGQTRHRAALHQVYIRSSERGRGGFALLLDAAVAQARAEGVVQLELFVAETNARAVAAYLRQGFAQAAVMPRALAMDGRFVDELLLVMRLDG